MGKEMEKEREEKRGVRKSRRKRRLRSKKRWRRKRRIIAACTIEEKIQKTSPSFLSYVLGFCFSSSAVGEQLVLFPLCLLQPRSTHCSLYRQLLTNQHFTVTPKPVDGNSTKSHFSFYQRSTLLYSRMEMVTDVPCHFRNRLVSMIIKCDGDTVALLFSPAVSTIQLAEEGKCASLLSFREFDEKIDIAH